MLTLPVTFLLGTFNARYTILFEADTFGNIMPCYIVIYRNEAFLLFEGKTIGQAVVLTKGNEVLFSGHF